MQDRPKTVPDLFTPIALGPLSLPNRIVMAPLTRSRRPPQRAHPGLNALYYAQRASAGLIIAEATQIMPEGQGYISTPGIHSAEQIAGWRCVTGAGPRVRRPHRAPALACGAHFASILPAWRRVAGGALSDSAKRPSLHRAGLRADPDPARAPHRRDPRHCRAKCTSGPECARRRLRRRRGASRQRLPNQSRTAAGSCSRWSTRSPRPWASSARGCISPQNGQNEIADSDPQSLINHVASALAKACPISM